LYFSPKIGFGAPLLEGLMKKEKIYPKLFDTIFIPFILGLVGGLILLGLDFAMPKESLLSMPSALLIRENPFYSLLGSISAGINEELISRFFVMSFLIWLIIRLLKKKEPSHFIIWISIALSAFIFASAHLVTIPLLYGAFESWICLKLIILNLIIGILFGWIYWEKGLESAMVAHFSTDIVLHVVFPLFV
jgi:hypothetical protein